MKFAGLAFTTTSMAAITAFNFANTLNLYIENDYRFNEEVIASMEATAISGFGTLLSGIALRGCYKNITIMEESGAFCFTKGTKVLTEEGYKNIEDIEVGDYVYSTDEETGESDYKEVLQIFVNETEVITHVYYEDTDGNIQEIESTINHRFWANGEWKSAGTLKAGDLLTLSDGTQTEVVEIVFEDCHETVYNMEVEDYHTYYVGEDGVWVHNTYKGKTAESGSKTIKNVEAPILPEGSLWERNVLNSFAGGKSYLVTYEGGTTLYRVGGKNGGFWSLDPPPATEYQWRVDTAIKQEFCNDATTLYKMTIPEGATLSGLEGKVGSQGMGLYGGAHQVYIDYKAVPSDWIEITPMQWK